MRGSFDSNVFKDDIEVNSFELKTELGTYIPLRVRLQQMRQAGIDTMAYRRAMADFADGTQSINLDDYDDETLSMDEIDFLEKKFYFDAKFKADKEAKEKAKQKKHDAEVIASYEKSKTNSLNEIDESPSSSSNP